MPDETVGVVQGWMTRPKGSLAIVIPRAVREAVGYKKGDRFIVKLDEQKRIVYEKLPDGRGHDAPTPASPIDLRHGRIEEEVSE